MGAVPVGMASGQAAPRALGPCLAQRMEHGSQQSLKSREAPYGLRKTQAETTSEAEVSGMTRAIVVACLSALILAGCATAGQFAGQMVQIVKSKGGSAYSGQVHSYCDRVANNPARQAYRRAQSDALTAPHRLRIYCDGMSDEQE